MSRTKITKLSRAEQARFDEWADRWIAVGLSTDRADRPAFEAAARACYHYARLAEPKIIIWAPSPLVVALAGPIAARLVECMSRQAGAVAGAVTGAVRGAVTGAVRGAVDDAVRGAVTDAVTDAVGDAVAGGVTDAVDDAVGDAVGDAVHDAVTDAVRGAVDDAVHDAVAGAVRDAVADAVRGAVTDAVGGYWHRVLGGQFWVGGWWWGGAWSSFFREVCHLTLPGNLWDRARAYETTMQSACWWWPHRDFIIVSERPSVIHREPVDPKRLRGWRSHRLHCATGPAVAWDGWGVYAWHGVRVPAQVIDAPETLTARQIVHESNAEVRRVMVERFGAANFLREMDATVVDNDPEIGILRRGELPGDEPVVMVTVLNSTPEPNGTRKPYSLRVPPTIRTAREAVAWTFDVDAKDYAPTQET